MAAPSTLSKIKRHFACVPRDQMVATRDILIHGKRSSVDSAIYVLIKQKFIWRIARGVFIRNGARWPKVAEIAEFKARAFNRTLRTHGNDAAVEFKLSGAEENEKATYYIDSASSSFGHRNGRIFFKGVSKKRIFLDDSPASRAIRALWSRGKKRLTMQEIKSPRMPWNHNREALNLFLNSKQWMPSWLSDCIQTAAYIGPPPIRYPVNLATE